jgi:hypothetical protein
MLTSLIRHVNENRHGELEEESADSRPPGIGLT